MYKLFLKKKRKVELSIDRGKQKENETKREQTLSLVIARIEKEWNLKTRFPNLLLREVKPWDSGACARAHAPPAWAATLSVSGRCAQPRCDGCPSRSQSRDSFRTPRRRTLRLRQRSSRTSLSRCSDVWDPAWASGASSRPRRCVSFHRLGEPSLGCAASWRVLSSSSVRARLRRGLCGTVRHICSSSSNRIVRKSIRRCCPVLCCNGGTWEQTLMHLLQRAESSLRGCFYLRWLVMKKNRTQRFLWSSLFEFNFLKIFYGFLNFFISLLTALVNQQHLIDYRMNTVNTIAVWTFLFDETAQLLRFSHFAQFRFMHSR